ncbi:MAG: sensor histidine kinase [Acidimicrobiia bacterium]
MRRTLRTIWNEPAVADAPPPTRWDWVLSATVVVVALTEFAFRSMPWESVQLVFTLALALVLPWRRTHPLLVTVFAYTSVVAIEVATNAAGVQGSDGIYAGVVILLIPFALTRWGSGRDMLMGLPILVVFPWVSLTAGNIDFAETAAGTVFLLFPAVLGASVRYWSSARERAVEEARLYEREQLARELHDTVAHHVSAIAIQAQAGRTVAATDPSAAIRALDTIEAEASRTLAEMRAMVGVLRRDEEAELAPQAGVTDIAHLADATGPPRVIVQISGDLDQLSSTVGAAVYRMAQESITNARRHARGATAVNVHVTGGEDTVHLTVADDGEVSGPADNSDGFGLTGMAERAKLLGGSFRAGPGPERGWMVEATVPRGGGGQ